MKLLLQREPYGEKSTLGELFENGKHFVYTLELPWKSNQHGVSCIPPGTYQVTLEPSAKFGGRKTPHIKNVPGRDNILIHVGNYPHDTEGCVVVGLTKSKDFVGESVKAFSMVLIQIALAFIHNETVEIEIREA